MGCSDKGLLIKFNNKEQCDKILNLWSSLETNWKAYTRVLGHESAPLLTPILAEDGWSYIVLKSDDCSVDNINEVGYDDAYEVLKHCVINGLH